MMEIPRKLSTQIDVKKPLRSYLARVMPPSDESKAGRGTQVLSRLFGGAQCKEHEAAIEAFHTLRREVMSAPAACGAGGRAVARQKDSQRDRKIARIACASSAALRNCATRRR